MLFAALLSLVLAAPAAPSPAADGCADPGLQPTPSAAAATTPVTVTPLFTPAVFPTCSTICAIQRAFCCQDRFQTCNYTCAYEELLCRFDCGASNLVGEYLSTGVARTQAGSMPPGRDQDAGAATQNETRAPARKGV